MTGAWPAPVASRAFIPSPPVNGLHVGPLDVHLYGLMYVVGIALAMIITTRRWQAVGGEPGLVTSVALWAVPAGILGARLYFDLTTPFDMPRHWWGPFAVWTGGLGVWGGILAGGLAGIWRVRRAGADWRLMADAAAPALLVAQAVGRLGNYFNSELYGKPSGLPWALEISPAHRVAGFAHYATFQPSFLYELIFDLALAAALTWLGHHRDIRPPGLFALYVTGYSAYRIFEETIRIDSSAHFLGLRLNLYIAIAGTLAGAAWCAATQRRRHADRLDVTSCRLLPARCHIVPTSPQPLATPSPRELTSINAGTSITTPATAPRPAQPRRCHIVVVRTTTVSHRRGSGQES